MQVIQHYEAGSGGVSSFNFTSIPTDGTYTDLLLKWSHRNTGAETQTRITINGSSSNFSHIVLYGLGNTQAVYTAGPNFPTWSATSSNTANTFASTSLYIPNFAGGNNKQIAIESAIESMSVSTGIYHLIEVMEWASAGAVGQITLTPAANNFAQYSSATLYGITAGSDGTTVVS